MPKIVQNEYTKAYNKEHYKNVSIKVSPEEAAEIDEIARQAGQSKARLIVNAVRFYAQSLTAAETTTPETPSTVTPAPQEIATPTITTTTSPSPAGATKTPTEPRQDGQPDYISTAGEDAQRAAENVTERAGEDQPEQIRIYTEAELKQAIQEAATQAAQKAARQARQEIKREMKAQAIQATGRTIEAARRAKAATVSTVNGLKPLRIRRGKK